ncbi:hypothetical protein MCHI_001723 [Candidatus Magnetoovum chiemensis]|nr:hypothetical protein MCHI_001723 [Candidatus Magnetoovum chiemensis]
MKDSTRKDIYLLLLTILITTAFLTAIYFLFVKGKDKQLQPTAYYKDVTSIVKTEPISTSSKENMSPAVKSSGLLGNVSLNDKTKNDIIDNRNKFKQTPVKKPLDNKHENKQNDLNTKLTEIDNSASTKQNIMQQETQFEEVLLSLENKKGYVYLDNQNTAYVFAYKIDELNEQIMFNSEQFDLLIYAVLALKYKNDLDSAKMVFFNNGITLLLEPFYKNFAVIYNNKHFKWFEYDKSFIGKLIEKTAAE